MEPEIRFKGYENKWTKIMLGDLGTWLKGSNLSKADLDNNGHFECIHYGELFVEYNEVINRIKSKTNIESVCKSKIGDILFPDSDVTPDGLARCSAIMKDGVILGGGIIIFRLSQNYYAPFVSYSINNEKKQLISKVTGTTVRHIKAASLAKIEIFISNSYEEQQKISVFFENLDKQISLQAQRLEKLKQIKSACLQSMFPQEGELVPKVRFKGFEDSWKRIPLKAFARKCINKNTNREYDETFTNSAEFGVVSQKDYFDHSISKEGSINGYYIIEPEDFVYNPRISASAPVGPINRNLLNRVGIMSPLYFIFRVDGINKSYLSYFFKTTLWHKFMFLNGNTGARFDRLSITDDKFLEMPISTPPSLAEQQKVAAYFENLDKQISLQTQRLEKLKQIKSACLDKMFV